jgi:antitoxin ParD1/3/4
MSVVKLKISVSDNDNNWIKSQLKTGQFSDESEIVHELIRERQSTPIETQDEIQAIRAALIEGENSGISDKTVEEIFANARQNLTQ